MPRAMPQCPAFFYGGAGVCTRLLLATALQDVPTLFNALAVTTTIPTPHAQQVPTAPQYLTWSSAITDYVLIEALPSCGQTEQLLAFRASFDNGETLLANWTGINPCAWSGIGCNDNRQVVGM